MKVRFKNKKKENPNVKIYIMDCTEAEKAEYKTFKGGYYREDEKTGKPLYFAERAMSSKIDYTLVDGSLVSAEESKMQESLDKLAEYDGMSFEDLQKLQIIKAMEAGV